MNEFPAIELVSASHTRGPFRDLAKHLCEECPGSRVSFVVQVLDTEAVIPTSFAILEHEEGVYLNHIMIIDDSFSVETEPFPCDSMENAFEMISTFYESNIANGNTALNDLVFPFQRYETTQELFKQTIKAIERGEQVFNLKNFIDGLPELPELAPLEQPSYEHHGAGCEDASSMIPLNCTVH